jgi:RNA recognition motif-containing protein
MSVLLLKASEDISTLTFIFFTHDVISVDIRNFTIFSVFSEELRDHFGQYGEIESINVKTDPNTGRSRGFAFIVFNNAEAIDKVVAAGEHIINNKKVDPKKAKARHGKIFVGGLTNELSDDDIKNYFSQYGNVSCDFTRRGIGFDRESCCRLSRWRCLLIKQKIREKVSVSSRSNRNRSSTSC